MPDIGPLLASGRDCDIFEYGDGRVLRRSRSPRSLAGEAAVMDHVRLHRYPAPAVHEVSEDGREIVMDRVEGATMGADLARRPWMLRPHAATLADLHDRLHAIPALPGSQPAPGGGDRQIHLDLHPLNVLMSPAGPVVIDWTNASRGQAAVDVASTWIIMGSSEVDGPLTMRVMARALLGLFVRAFLSHVDRPAAVARLRTVAEHRVCDRNVRPHEVEAIWRLVDRAEAGGR